MIADDEPMMRASLRDHLAQSWPELEVVSQCEDGLEAAAVLRSTPPDFAFLDIRMPGLTGLEVARVAPTTTRIIFVTAHDQFALQAFDAHAVDYLVKPIEPQRLQRTVERLATMRSASQPQVHDLIAALQALPEGPTRAGPVPNVIDASQSLDWLQIDCGRQIRMVHVDDVMYFESDHKYTRVVAEDADGLMRMSLKELLARVDIRRFLQVHRAVVVNRRFVRGVVRVDDTMELELKGRPEKLRVSESNQPLFRAM